MNKSQQQALLGYIDEQAKVADQNSKEWKEAGDEVNAAYRAGMWYAYNDIRNRIPNEQQTDPATAISRLYPSSARPVNPQSK